MSSSLSQTPYYSWKTMGFPTTKGQSVEQTEIDEYLEIPTLTNLPTRAPPPTPNVSPPVSSNGRQMNIPKNENVQKIFTKLDEVKNVMHDNISKQLENMEKAETINSKAEELMYSSMEFNKKSKELKRKMCWKNIRMRVAIYGSLLLLLVIIIICLIGISGGFNK